MMVLRWSQTFVIAAMVLALASGSAAGAAEPSPDTVQAIAPADSVPPLIHFQGRLGDATGTPLPDGEESLSFHLYDRRSGGTALWTESKTLQVTGGGFETLLGDTTAFDPRLLSTGDLWLGVMVGGGAELTPRYRLTSAPFAIRSADADALGGITAAGYASAGHDHDDRYVNVDGDRMEAGLARTPVLEVMNTDAGYGISGQSASNVGVFGASGAGSGLVGISGLTGVYGSGETTGVIGSGRQTGVEGLATSRSGGATGVRGRGTIGVWGESEAGTGLHGDGGQYGVYGESEAGMGVFGVSDTAYGVHARSASAPALYATSPLTGVVGIGGMSGAGVYGEARGGVGVSGSGDAGVFGSGMIGVHGEGLTGVQGRGQQQGVLGTSERLGGVGVLGRDAVGSGVKGEGHTGVLGVGTGSAGVSGTGSPGVKGQSDISEGVVGESSASSGVKGFGPVGLEGVSTSAMGGTGVHGSAPAGTGVMGEGAYAGVYGLGASRGLFGKATDDRGTGVYAENPDGVAIFGAGDIAQTLVSEGLVKAAVYAWCDSASARIERSFSQVYGRTGDRNPIIAIRGKQTGDCSINFGFDVSDRFVQASAVSTSLGREARGVTVRDTGATRDVLGFFRWDADGAGSAGYIYVQIY